MLSIKNLSKNFGSLQAVSNLSFTAPKGQITGLIGQNGAGKTTTFHSILNFLSYQGNISWNHKPITESTLDEIGYLPEERSLLPKLTVEQHILYLAKLKGQTGRHIKPLINKWLKRFSVKGRPNQKIKDLSKGNQQKVQLICTLIHQPKLLILDEPFGGLDPVNADLLKQAILEAKNQGAAVIFSSHNMVNVQSICDRLVMLSQGKAVLNGTLEEVREQFGKTELYVSGSWPETKLKDLLSVDSIKKLSSQRYLLHLKDPKAGPEIFDRLTGGHYIAEFSQQAPSLDQIFRLKAGEKNA